MLRDRLIEWAVLGVTGAGTGAAIALLWSSGFKSDDVFAFSGALVGAAGTVAGAAWLADRAATSERRAEQSIIVEALRAARDKAYRTRTLYDAEAKGWPPEFRTSLHAAKPLVDEANAIATQALAQAKTLNFRQRARLESASKALDAFKLFYDDCFSESDL